MTISDEKGTDLPAATENATGANLKPCPFCGGEAELTTVLFVGVRCCTRQCVEIGYWADRDKAVAAWNKRAEPAGVELLEEWLRQRAPGPADWDRRAEDGRLFRFGFCVHTNGLLIHDPHWSGGMREDPAELVQIALEAVKRGG